MESINIIHQGHLTLDLNRPEKPHIPISILDKEAIEEATNCHQYVLSYEVATESNQVLQLEVLKL